MAKVIFYSVTQAQYNTLVSNAQIKETALYFTSDTHRLYKGSFSYTGGGGFEINTIGVEEDFPLTGTEDQFYTKPSVFETRIWKDNAWVELVLPISTSIISTSTHLQYASAKAVYDLVSGLNIPSIDGLEAASNKVTSITSGSTDVQYPSAKAVYTIVNGLSIPSIDGLEVASNKVTTISGESTDVQYPSAKAVYTIISGLSIPSIAGLEVASNKVTTISGESTDVQYPSAKAVYNIVSNLSIPSIDGLEAASNKVTSITSGSTDVQYPSAKAVYNIVSGLSIPSIDGLEAASNKVTSITSGSTDVQYPSAKAVYTAISGLSSEGGSDGLGFEFLGAYSAIGTYYKQSVEHPNASVVTYEGSVWVYNNATSTGHTAPPSLPTTSNEWWVLFASKGVDGVSGGGGGGGGLSTVLEKSADYQLLIENSFATVVSTGASPVILSLPSSASVGTWFTFAKMGSGKLTVQAPSGEVIMDSSVAGTFFCDSASTMFVCTLEKIASDTWILKSGTGLWETA